MSKSESKPLSTPVFTAINGAAGRMGQRLVALIQDEPQMRLAVALDAPQCKEIGNDALRVAGVARDSVPITSQWPQTREGGAVHADVMIDFTLPVGCRAAIKTCVDLTRANPQSPVALVIGTTGLTADDYKLIDEAAAVIPVLQAANMSLGVNLLLGLAAQVAQRLGDDYDIEIVESHHRMKADAPSGTALAIAQAVCDATGKSMTDDLVHGRSGAHVPRKRGEIGMHAARSGDIVGKHTISFGTMGEELALTHTASTRDVFARGALRAARWLVGKPAGRYSMKDVLGL